MRQTNNKLAMTIGLLGLAVLIIFVIATGINLTKDMGKSKAVVATENAEEALNKLYKDISVRTLEPRKEPITMATSDLKDTLPDIQKYPEQVQATTPYYVEIISSPEKTGKGKDGWLVDVANDFNKAKIEVDGKVVSVSIRGMASGMAMDYIVSGKHVPDAYTPSNALWGEMLKAQGIPCALLEEKMLGNTAGILMSKTTQETLKAKYGTVDIKSIAQAVAGNEIAMGYTNPFASSTGLNFLLSTLHSFDSQNILSDEAIAGFESFQANIPFVAYTTMQMRESAETGLLDAFILEYQTYINSPDLRRDYLFIPFGIAHDSPLYATGQLSAEKEGILEAFVAFSKEAKYQKLATEYGFNGMQDTKGEKLEIAGDTIQSAQRLWKEKKDSNRSISAVFVADVSGSMEGAPIQKLKESLLNGMQYIDKEHSVGLVTYSDQVYVNLPINKFDINHRSYFAGAVTDLSAGGGTATYDGIIVATKMLIEEKINNPNAKLMLFVLSDGETNAGHDLDEIEGILKAFSIPVYTIGYNANIEALARISNINEAASINADSEDVVYQLASLFNAQM
ncbi:MAG: VWA domain-containing protein [Cellulosilyticaceae bacterium]